ncbi:hypothetical protein NNC19_07465 [Clostridium sp. SHJSY1]|uniref:hypothetical protein n=1 Tax=Clostridium sp. SHJSY1 TaxID=2942483 RepID=UPI002874690F|nr:hypothetical protein [Clostridium sp. SHJSY1]MDS0525513.1 hypothetical protein [Clostridium sp. SHJSY1]
MVTIQQFEYFQLDDNAFGNTKILVSTMPYVIGEVFIDEVLKGDAIWLNAVVGGVDNNKGCISPYITFNLYKGNVFIPGKEIYFAPLDADKAGDVTNVPISYVDSIDKGARNVRYVLAVQIDEGIQNVFIRGPITFTALQFRP